MKLYIKYCTVYTVRKQNYALDYSNSFSFFLVFIHIPIWIIYYCPTTREISRRKKKTVYYLSRLLDLKRYTKRAKFVNSYYVIEIQNSVQFDNVVILSNIYDICVTSNFSSYIST